MKKTILIATLLTLSAQLAFAEKGVQELQFSETKIAQDVFVSKAPGQASFYILDQPYNEWKTKNSGQFFKMEVAPVIRGMATGGIPQQAAPKVIDASKWQDQAADFAEAVNLRNKGGRQVFEKPPGSAAVSPDKMLAAEEKGTYVVQSVLSTVIDRPITQMKMTTEGFVEMTKNIDQDHTHFTIPGSFALEALEKDHVAARTIIPNQAYLLSAIDFRDYECQSMKTTLNDYFNKLSEKQRLYKETIYMISDMQVNNADDLASMQSYLGKRPDMVLGQTILYADHLVRGGRTVFAFFAEGNQTRVVLISNLALRAKYFAGSKTSKISRPIIMGGIGGAGWGVAADIGNAALNVVNDGGKSLLSKATLDLAKKNQCNRGLARGLIKYSQTMFSRFASYMLKN